MLYEIINPSDKYTIKSDDFLAVCVATCILGEGAYALQGVGNDEGMPLFLFGGVDEWFNKRFGLTFEQALNKIAPADLATCLDSVVVGDRELYDSTLPLIKESDRAQWIEQWNDKNTSSLNNIGRRAKALAERMRRRGN